MTEHAIATDKYGPGLLKVKKLRMYLYLAGLTILAVGLGSAAVIYWTVADDTDQVAGYEIAGGTVYPVSPEDSKTYRHDLEVFGGRSAVISDAVGRWFSGLWHGRSLALTVACIVVLVSLGLFFVGARLPHLLFADVGDKETQT
jgi:hypothetical protein